MKRAGIIGGMGPESTVDYYRRLQEEWRRFQPGSAPAMVIDSLDPDVALHLVAKDRAAFFTYFKDSIDRLARAGVDFIAMTANTPHMIFDELAAQSPVPMISIVETCVEEAQRRRHRRLALLGTRFTMEASFYPDVFARAGIEVVRPRTNEVTWVHERYVGELLRGAFRPETRAEFMVLVERLRAEDRVDGVILGGTELPMLLNSTTIAGLPVLDTTAIHVTAIITRLREPVG